MQGKASPAPEERHNDRRPRAISQTARLLHQGRSRLWLLTPDSPLRVRGEAPLIREDFLVLRALEKGLVFQVRLRILFEAVPAIDRAEIVDHRVVARFHFRLPVVDFHSAHRVDHDILHGFSPVPTGSHDNRV